MTKRIEYLALMLVLIHTVVRLQLVNSQQKTSSSVSDDVMLEFDESDVRNLNLKLKWRYVNTNMNNNSNDTSSGVVSKSGSIPTRFVLLMETKRINFSTFLFDYSSPQLIDDEQVFN